MKYNEERDLRIALIQRLIKNNFLLKDKEGNWLKAGQTANILAKNFSTKKLQKLDKVMQEKKELAVYREQQSKVIFNTIITKTGIGHYINSKDAKHQYNRLNNNK